MATDRIKVLWGPSYGRDALVILIHAALGMQQSLIWFSVGNNHLADRIPAQNSR